MKIRCHKKEGFPNSNSGTVETAQNKKGNPNEWCHKNLQKVILGLVILVCNLCVVFNVLNNCTHRKVADIVGCY